MTALTYTQFLNSLGWFKISSFASYDKAMIRRYTLSVIHINYEYVLLENLYVVDDKWEIWEKSR